MLRYVSRRLLWAIPTLLVITFLVFLALRSGTDPVAELPAAQPAGHAGRRSSSTRRSTASSARSPEQYFRWLGHFVTGNWGSSIKGSRPVWPELKDAMANTLVLGVVATVVGISVGLAIGILSALRPYSKFDTVATTGAFVGISIPPFVSAVLLQTLLRRLPDEVAGSVASRSCPRRASTQPGHQGFDLVLRVKHLILPVIGRGHPDHRRLQPVHAGVAARGHQLRLHAHRPGQGHLRARA